jgi:hypothetical protein
MYPQYNNNFKKMIKKKSHNTQGLEVWLKW